MENFENMLNLHKLSNHNFKLLNLDKKENDGNFLFNPLKLEGLLGNFN